MLTDKTSLTHTLFYLCNTAKVYLVICTIVQSFQSSLNVNI